MVSWKFNESYSLAEKYVVFYDMKNIQNIFIQFLM